MILGNYILVMASLAELEEGQVQMALRRSPYLRHRFGSNWQVCTRKRDVKDGKVRGHDARAGGGEGVP